MEQTINTNEISSEVVLEGSHFGEITLCGEGYLKILVNPQFKEITIDKLTNNKTNASIHKYDILITSKDGEDAPNGHGDNGMNGEHGGKFKITVNNLINDVNVFVRGSYGGCGGDGSQEAKKGGKGGDGGNGGDACDVTFYYGYEGDKPTGTPKLYDCKGGIGGCGGNGGLCTDPIGKGETPTNKQTKGGKNGDGGKAGQNGKNGSFEVHSLKEKKTQSIRYLNLNNENDYNSFIKTFGGEATLKKYPKIWNSIQAKKNRNALTENNEEKLKIDDSITTACLIPNNLKQNTVNKVSNSEATSFKFKINSFVNTFNCKASDTAEERAKKQKYMPTSCTRVLEIYELKDNVEYTLLQKSDFFEKHPDQIIDEIHTNYFPASQISNKDYKIRISYLYQTENGEIFPARNECQVQTGVVGSFFDSICIEAPRYRNPQQKRDDYIRFLYGRRPSQNEEYDGNSDYYGDEYERNQNTSSVSGQVDIPTTIVPITGVIYFNSVQGKKIKSISLGNYVQQEPDPFDSTKTNTKIYQSPQLAYTLNSGKEKLLVAMGNGNKYNNKDLGEHFRDLKNVFVANVSEDDDDNTIVKFDLHLRNDNYTNFGKYDWEAKITDSHFFTNGEPYENNCGLSGSLPITLVFNDGSKNEDGSPIDRTMNFTLSFCSCTKEELPPGEKYFEGSRNNTWVYIPRLMICWGCYAADTLITTTEGVKKASDIKRGDKLPVYGRKILTVSQVYIGDDKWICNIRTTNNKSIRVSSGHAMKLYCENTADGKKISAGKIKKGDILMTPNGNVEVDSVEIEAYNDKVYNFEFIEEMTPNYIEANGFWSGDFNAQNEPEKRDLPDEAKVFVEEMKQLAAELSKKAQQ